MGLHFQFSFGGWFHEERLFRGMERVRLVDGEPAHRRYTAVGVASGCKWGQKYISLQFLPPFQRWVSLRDCINIQSYVFYRFSHVGSF
jgi:hypothetical protein